MTKRHKALKCNCGHPQCPLIRCSCVAGMNCKVLIARKRLAVKLSKRCCELCSTDVKRRVRCRCRRLMCPACITMHQDDTFGCALFAILPLQINIHLLGASGLLGSS